jgi:uncharacterized RDD family membrane protein YckC
VIDRGATDDAPEGFVPAGVLRRLPATLIDMVVYCGICACLAYPVGRNIDWLAAFSDPERLMESLTDPNWVGHAAGILGLWIALWWCYFAVGWGLVGATVGKRLFGLLIVDHQGRSPIGLSRAFLRLAAYSVSSVTLGMGHLLVVLRPDRRALHDVLAGTWVVKRNAIAPVAAPRDDENSPSEDDSENGG